MDDETVYVEKYGLSLPLSGLPSQVSNETETQLGILLCQIMGYGYAFFCSYIMTKIF